MKKQPLRAALDNWKVAAANVEYQKNQWKGLPARIHELEEQAAAVKVELSAALDKLSQPYEEYKLKWIGRECRPANPAAYEVYKLMRRDEFQAGLLRDARQEKRRGRAAMMEQTEAIKKQAAVELWNAAAVAASKAGVKNPLCQTWEHLSVDQVVERVDPLATAEEAKKESKKKRKERKEEGEVREVVYKLEAGAACIEPAELLEAVKGAAKSKKDYILIGRGVLIPAITFVDWLRLISDEPERLRLELNNRTQVLKAKIARTVAEFKGIDAGEVVDFSQDKGEAINANTNILRVCWRVNLVRG